MSDSNLRQRNTAISEPTKEKSNEHLKDKSAQKIQKNRFRELSDTQIFIISIIVGLIVSGAFVAFVGKVVTGSWSYGFFEGSKVSNPMAATLGRKYYKMFPKKFTKEELLQYDGSDKTKPIYLAIKGKVYDVTAGAKYYGPGGGYHGFAGRDATKAFLNLCFTEECKVDDLSDVTEEQMKGIDEWVDFYEKDSKYFYVGEIVKDK